MEYDLKARIAELEQRLMQLERRRVDRPGIRTKPVYAGLGEAFKEAHGFSSGDVVAYHDGPGSGWSLFTAANLVGAAGTGSPITCAIVSASLTANTFSYLLLGLHQTVPGVVADKVHCLLADGSVVPYDEVGSDNDGLPFIYPTNGGFLVTDPVDKLGLDYPANEIERNYGVLTGPRNLGGTLKNTWSSSRGGIYVQESMFSETPFVVGHLLQQPYTGVGWVLADDSLPQTLCGIVVEVSSEVVPDAGTRYDFTLFIGGTDQLPFVWTTAVVEELNAIGFLFRSDTPGRALFLSTADSGVGFLPFATMYRPRDSFGEAQDIYIVNMVNYALSGADASKLQGIPIDETDPTDGQALVYDGTAEEWKPGKVPFNQLEYTLQTSTDFTIPLTSEYLGVGAASPAPNGGFRHTLFPRGDFNAKWLMQKEISSATPTTNQSLVYNGTSWGFGRTDASLLQGRPVNATLPLGNSIVLLFDGAQWTGGPVNAVQLRGVELSSESPADNNVLVFSAADNQWRPRPNGLALMGKPAPDPGGLIAGTLAVYHTVPTGRWVPTTGSGGYYNVKIIGPSTSSLAVEGLGATVSANSPGNGGAYLETGLFGPAVRLDSGITARTIQLRTEDIPNGTLITMRQVTYLESTGVSKTRWFLCGPA